MQWWMQSFVGWQAYCDRFPTRPWQVACYSCPSALGGRLSMAIRTIRPLSVRSVRRQIAKLSRVKEVQVQTNFIAHLRTFSSFLCLACNAWQIFTVLQRICGVKCHKSLLGRTCCDWMDLWINHSTISSSGHAWWQCACQKTPAPSKGQGQWTTGTSFQFGIGLPWDSFDTSMRERVTFIRINHSLWMDISFKIGCWKSTVWTVCRYNSIHQSIDSVRSCSAFASPISATISGSETWSRPAPRSRGLVWIPLTGCLRRFVLQDLFLMNLFFQYASSNGSFWVCNEIGDLSFCNLTGLRVWLLCWQPLVCIRFDLVCAQFPIHFLSTMHEWRATLDILQSESEIRDAWWKLMKHVSIFF